MIHIRFPRFLHFGVILAMLLIVLSNGTHAATMLHYGAAPQHPASQAHEDQAIAPEVSMPAFSCCAPCNFATICSPSRTAYPVRYGMNDQSFLPSRHPDGLYHPPRGEWF